MTASGRRRPSDGGVEDVDVAGAAVGVVDDGEQPALVVAVAVERPGRRAARSACIRGRGSRTRSRPGRGRTSAGRPAWPPASSASGSRARARRPRPGEPQPRRSRASSRNGRPRPRSCGIHPWILDVALVHLRPLDLLARRSATLQDAERPADPREPHAGRADDRTPRGRRVAPLRARRSSRRRGTTVTVGLVVGPEHVRHQAGIEPDPPHRRIRRRRHPRRPPRGTTPTQPSAPGTHPNGTAAAPPWSAGSRGRSATR